MGEIRQIYVGNFYILNVSYCMNFIKSSRFICTVGLKWLENMYHFFIHIFNSNFNMFTQSVTDRK
jgi:hypothetical protein